MPGPVAAAAQPYDRGALVATRILRARGARTPSKSQDPSSLGRPRLALTYSAFILVAGAPCVDVTAMVCCGVDAIETNRADQRKIEGE